MDYPMKNESFGRRLSFALGGLRAAWQRERSFRTQVYVGAGTMAVTVALRPGLLWTGLVFLAIAMVLAMELANSAIEYMIDHLHPDVAPQIKLAKDVAAGAVLVVSFGAFCVGVLMIAAVLTR
jgi:diacylglycerol kinase